MSAETPSALFWAYDTQEPSFRYRVDPVARALSARGWDCRVETFPKRRYVRRIYERLAEVAATDLVFLHRIKASPLELGPLRRNARALVYDFDDAIYFRRPRKLGEEPDRSWFRRYKFQATCKAVDLVIAGNPTIGEMAARSARRVEIVPTSVDTAVYAAHRPAEREPHTVVWIGLPENVQYLDILRPALARLSREFPRLKLRVVSSRFPDWDDVKVEKREWSSESEIDLLTSAGIGAMPLSDDDWTRGKCAFKLIQYMAAGIVPLASPVGANTDAIEDGVSGLLAATTAQWEDALRRVLSDPPGAARMADAAKRRAQERYDRTAIAARTADLCEQIRSATRVAARAA